MGKTLKKYIIIIIAIALIISVSLYAWITYRKTPEYFIKSGAFVVVHNDIFNYVKLADYFAAGAHQNGENITIVIYTVEGDPLVIKINFYDELYMISYDSSNDRFGKNQNLNMKYNQKTVLTENGNTEYVFYNGDEPDFTYNPNAD